MKVKLRVPTLILVSAILTLIGLALMVWSVIQPTPLPTILAMSLGQVFGTSAFGLYLLVIVLDLRRDARERRRVRNSLPPPLGAPGDLPKPSDLVAAPSKPPQESDPS
jgi:hypothetical protein